jgi:hypothetical protein
VLDSQKLDGVKLNDAIVSTKCPCVRNDAIFENLAWTGERFAVFEYFNEAFTVGLLEVSMNQGESNCVLKVVALKKSSKLANDCRVVNGLQSIQLNPWLIQGSVKAGIVGKNKKC